jgi:hypothetical protein
MFNLESDSNRLAKVNNVPDNKIIDLKNNSKSFNVFWGTDKYKENPPPFRNTNENKIICKSYDPEKDDFESTIGFVLQKSKQNILFLSEHQFQKGSPVYIQSKISDLEVNKNGLEDWGHAQVIRCKNIEESNHHWLYRIMAEYF